MGEELVVGPFRAPPPPPQLHQMSGQHTGPGLRPRPHATEQAFVFPSTPVVRAGAGLLFREIREMEGLRF